MSMVPIPFGDLICDQNMIHASNLFKDIELFSCGTK